MRDWIRGRVFDRDRVRKGFHTLRCDRRLDRLGSAHFRRWKIDGEYGLAHQQAAIWLTAENLTIAFHDQPRADESVSYDTAQKRLISVRDPRLLATIFSSQPVRWPMNDAERRKVVPPPHVTA